ncbi:MAG: ABC transporter ATP-binding protein/permease [Spirochaetaceae bacterium]|nr:ABC transporter ATP-binding protein/permease [Spirochaetaceae bacterium]
MSEDKFYPPAADLRSSMHRPGGRPKQFEKAKNPRKALVRLAWYLKPYGASMALVLVLIVVSSLLGLVGPYLLGLAIDTFIANKDLAGLGRVALMMLASYVLSNLFLMASNWVMARVSQYALRELRKDLFGHLQTLPMRFFDTHPAGGLMSRLTNDIDAINQAVSQNVTSLVASVVTMVGILAAMFTLNHWLALASLVVVPIMFGFTRFIAKYTRKGFRNLQENLGKLNETAEESISGIKTIKAFRRKDSVIAEFSARNQAVYEAGVYANSYSMLLMPLTQLLGDFFVVVLAASGSWLALKGMASVGTIASFVNYGHNFTSPLRQVANLYNSIQAALAGAERVFEIIDTPGEADDPGLQVEGAAADHAAPAASCAVVLPAGATNSADLPKPICGDVQFRNVQFAYVPGTPIIKDFSLDVTAGQTIALVGPTGAGKTTIINLLTRFYEIQGRSICIDGIDIREMRKDELRRNLGLVLQDTFLFADTVMENIRYGRLDASDEECIEAARMAEADHFIRQLPRDYQTNLSERAGNLSTGQRQLLSISRAILADPAILILDEATSSVDTRTEGRIQKALLRLMQGRTSFVIAHRLSTIRDADKVVVINNGGIVEQGSHDELIARRGFYYNLYVSQFKGHQI